MGMRGVATKLSDFLPDVLIEALRCDGITALKALERTVEDLAYNHGFFRMKLPRSYDGDTPCEGGRRLFYVDDASVLEVAGAELDGRPFIGRCTLEGGRIVADGDVWRNEGRIVFDVRVLPLMDEPFAEPELLTRGRGVIVAGALADVLGMSGRAWSDGERAQMWRGRFIEALESWKTRECLRNRGNRVLMGNNPIGYL